MRKTNLVFTLFLVISSAFFSGCSFWDLLNGMVNKPHDIVLEDREKLRWESLRKAELATESGAIPEGWSAGTFISDDTFKIFGSRLVGSTYRNTGSDSLKGSTLSIEGFDLAPQTGFMGATARVAATIPNYHISMSADVEVVVRFVRYEPANGEKKAQAVFRWQPVAIRPSIPAKSGSLAARGAFARVMADLLEMTQKSKLFEIRVPIDDRMTITFGVNQTGEIEIQETGGKIKYSAKSKISEIKRSLEFAPPLFGKDGVWLVGRVADGAPRDWSEDLGVMPPAERRTADIERMSAIIEMRLQKVDPGTDIIAYVNAGLIETLFSSFADLSEDERKIEINTTSSEGKLAEKKWRDNILGEGGVYAKLAEGGASLTGQLGAPTISITDTGISFSVPAKIVAEASVHAHIDPLIGGGVGTTIGITGSVNEKVAFQIEPRLVQSAMGKIAAIYPAMACKAIPVDIQTNGVLKFQGGWASVPKFGVRWQWPIGKQTIAPVSLLDERPIFMAFMPPPLKDNKNWEPGHRDPAAKLVIHPTQAQMSRRGMWFAGTVTIDSIPVSVNSREKLTDALARVEKELNKEIASIAKSNAEALKAAATIDCNFEDEFAVLIGEVEIGKNNDLVIFFKGVIDNLKRGLAVSGAAFDVGKKIAEMVVKLDKSKITEVSKGVKDLLKESEKFISASPAGKIMKDLCKGFEEGIKIGKDDDMVQLGPLKTKDPTHGLTTHGWKVKVW